MAPQDPSCAEYRQGHTLCSAYAHWFQVKFFSHYRRFFHCNQTSRVIVHLRINDDRGLRTYGSPTDAYQFEGCSEQATPQTAP